MKDINDNRMGVRTDALGMVISSFVMGKETESVGDEMDLNSVESSADDHSINLLEYDVSNYQLRGKPNFVKTKISDTYYPGHNRPCKSTILRKLCVQRWWR